MAYQGPFKFLRDIFIIYQYYNESRKIIFFEINLAFV